MNKTTVYLVGYYTQDVLAHYVGVFGSLERARNLRNALSEANIDRPFLICVALCDSGLCMKPYPKKREKLPF